ncbi:hypothetical protein SDC9_141718 [bioreactor metagenome]|uniref:Uncharacterized protein n=1 Tax=bioreactor metagenome TaxID=1076179 RepID=A0A645E1W0_9ZZZZ
MEQLLGNDRVSPQIAELREEMIDNLTERYNDLLREGKTPAAAFQMITADIGDVSELIQSLKRDSALTGLSADRLLRIRRLRGLRSAIATGCFILAAGFLFVIPYPASFLIFCTFIALAAGLLVYNRSTRLR